MSFDPEEILSAYGPGTEEEAHRCLVAADWFLGQGDRALAASALDRAYGLLPYDLGVARQRWAVLDELAVAEHGLVFRYVPAGTFLMGHASGDPDERPVHPRRLPEMWVTDIPITWAAYCRLLGWSAPPDGAPPANELYDADGEEVHAAFLHREDNKIRLQYCDSASGAALDWHSHRAKAGDYDRKPIVAVSATDAERLGAALSYTAQTVDRQPGRLYRLPTESEWEKAARGGLVGCRWSWGDDPPTHAICDFDRFGAFHLTDPRAYPANGYGLHSMCGGVAEWTADRYDALAYENASLPPEAPGPADARAIRGGSWTDCAAAVTVSFRASRSQRSWLEDEGSNGDAAAPNIGFRLVRF